MQQSFIFDPSRVNADVTREQAIIRATKGDLLQRCTETLIHHHAYEHTCTDKQHERIVIDEESSEGYRIVVFKAAMGYVR